MFRIPHSTVNHLCLSSAIIVTNSHRFLFPLPRKSTSGVRVVVPLTEYSREVVWILKAAIARQAESKNFKGLCGGKQISTTLDRPNVIFQTAS
jgi:hypothetical protein